MKKYLLLLLLIAAGLTGKANPIVPQANISEIYVDSTGNWIIEFGFASGVLEYIDSIRIETTSGSALVISFSVFACDNPNGVFDSLALITNSNLDNSLSIDPLNDFVRVTSYNGDYPVVDYVAIGNATDSYLDCLHDGESIVFNMCGIHNHATSSFSIDKSPTIGDCNDTTGAMGTFTGQIIDLDGNPFAAGYFFILYHPNYVTVHINPDSIFSERIYARRYTLDTITMYFPPQPYTKVIYAIEPIDFCLRPDSIVYQDIVTTSLVTGITEEEADFENAVTTAPNPFTDKVVFYFNFENFQANDQIILLIHDQSGKLIERKQLSIHDTRLDWMPDLHTSSGIFIFQLLKNNQRVKSGKLFKL